MEPAVQPLAAILELNTDLFFNCCQGLSEPDATRRLAGGGNSVAFLAAHLTHSRHYLADRLGAALQNPLAPLLAGGKGIDDIASLPPLEEILAAWQAIGQHLMAAVSSLSADDLSRDLPHRFPIAGNNPLTVLTFFVQHDSYHVGQVSFLRRQLGHGAMSYQRRPQPTSA